MYLCISNNCAIPLAAIEMIGGTDKSERQGMIGMFGSGLKYAIAAAMREGVEIIITTGEHVVKFGTRLEKLTNESVPRIMMQVDDNPPAPRDWTTLMGQKDWVTDKRNYSDVHWMIIREFLSNAIDEGGWSVGTVQNIKPQLAMTNIYIEYTPANEHVINNLPRYCLHIGNHKPIVKTCEGSILYRQTSDRTYVYNKGILVAVLPFEGFADYDFRNLRLSESRNLEHWYLQQALRDLWLSAPVDLWGELMQAMAKKEQVFENKFFSPSDFMYLNTGVIKAAFEKVYPNAYAFPESLDSVQLILLSHIAKMAVAFPDRFYELLKHAKVQTYSDLLSEDQKSGYDFEEPSAELQEMYDKLRRHFSHYKMPKLRTYKDGASPVYHSNETLAIRADVPNPKLYLLLAVLIGTSGKTYGTMEYTMAIGQELLARIEHEETMG